MSGLFGSTKTKSSQTTTNAAYPELQQAFGGTLNHGSQANDALSAMLGLGGDTAAQGAAFDNYKNSAGYQSNLDAGSTAVTNNQAAHGLLGSGSTLKRLTQFGQDLNNNYYKDYMSQLLGLGNQALGAGGLLAGAATHTTNGTQQQSQKPGLGQILGSVLTALPMA